MTSMGNHVTFVRFVFLADLYIFTSLETLSHFRNRFFFVQCIINQLLVSVFVIFIIIKVISLQLRHITPTSILIIMVSQKPYAMIIIILGIGFS